MSPAPGPDPMTSTGRRLLEKMSDPVSDGSGKRMYSETEELVPIGSPSQPFEVARWSPTIRSLRMQVIAECGRLMIEQPTCMACGSKLRCVYTVDDGGWTFFLGRRCHVRMLEFLGSLSTGFRDRGRA